MTESLINEWLVDCVDMSPVELHTFSNTLSRDNEIVRTLYTVLDERSKNSQLVDKVCDQFYEFYRSREVDLQIFTSQFLPTLIYIYLNSVARGDKKNCRTVETLLIGIYNLEVVDESGQPKTVSFRLPSLAMSSIYHEVRYERITPMSLAPASLTESALRRLEECNTKLVSWGPLPQVEALNAQNRLKVMTALLFVYNRHLSRLDKPALEQLCKVATKLVTRGFVKPGHHQRSSYGSDSSYVPRLLPRIPVSAQFLLEFLHAVYFAMYNDCWYVATQALEDIHNRACYEAYPDVMLVTNAIRNSISSGSLGQHGGGPMGISVALSPATSTVTVSKSMITNASFRTKKLPDDIPIQTAKDDSVGESKSNLVSITEEQETGNTSRAGSQRQPKDSKGTSKIANFPGLGKKPKDKDGKSAKNGYVTTIDKDKKLGSQTSSKENVRGSRSMLNNDSQEVENSVNGSSTRKKNSSLENSSSVSDSSTVLIEAERIITVSESVENMNSETLLGLKNLSESESLTSSVQVSSE